MMIESLLGNLPEKWETTTLGNICQRGGGFIQTGPFGSQLHAADYVETGIPTIMPKNIGENKVVETGISRITIKDAERLSKYRLRPGDIVYSRRGDVTRRALILDEQNGWLCGTGSLMVRLGEGIVDPRYVSYYLGDPSIREWIQRHAVGATMPNLNTSIMSAVPFVYPPLPEQRAIAGILGALTDKIEVNRRMNATLESMARAVFRQWFVENEEVENWEESSLEEIFRKKSGCVLTGPFGSHLHAHDYREYGTPLILVKHVMDGHILEDRLPMVGEHKLAEMKRYLLEVGDIVFTRVGAVGRSAYIHARHKGWLISGQTLRVRVPDKKKLNPRYLAQIYLEQSFIDMVEQHALGTTRPSLNTSILSSFKFVLPPIELQNKFVEFAESLDNKAQQNLDESRTLASLRDSLLPKLMRGDVRVKVEV